MTNQTTDIRDSFRLLGVPDGSGLMSEWLAAINAINAETPGWIGSPTTTGDWWQGGYCEEYPDFRVILHQDDGRTATIKAKTPAAAEALRRAVATVEGQEIYRRNSQAPQRTATRTCSASKPAPRAGYPVDPYRCTKPAGHAGNHRWK